MARRGVVDFQKHVKADAGFQTLLDDDENLWVMDVYTDWCGACTCATGVFQKANVQYNGQPVKFATVNASTISHMSQYDSTSQPTFIFMAGKGTILMVIRGVNVPLITRTIKDLIELEKKVKAGEAERVPFVDETIQPEEEEAEEVEAEAEAEEEEEEDDVPITVALIKPDAVADGKIPEILEKLEECGIDVMSQVERVLTREDAETFYEEHRGTDFFLQLIDYMTSGPIVALALATKDPNRDVVEQWRLLIGPKDVAIAREEAPESLRAQFSKGDDNYKNALHGSDSAETAARELAFFFPNFAKKRTGGAAAPTRVQRTLALIRPDALRKYKDDIISKIHAAGFEIANAKEVQLTAEQAAEFYKEHAEQDYFEKLIQHMSSGPVMALALCREDAVTNWREMLGPKNVEEAKDIAPDSLRAQYIEKEDDPGLNALHGSDSLESAEREVNFFFPQQQTLAVIKPDTNEEEKEVIMNKIRSSGFHIAAQKETVLTKELAEQFYMEHKDKEFFGELTDFMTSGPTMFMVLSREDAICGMREIVGPADPEEAKKTAPDSIRAVVGKDKLKNAIHAPDDEFKAMSAIKLAFGDELDFDEEGKVVEKPAAAAAPTDGEIEGSTHAAPDQATTEEAVAETTEDAAPVAEA